MTSARAIDSEVMKKLYHFNLSFTQDGLTSGTNNKHDRTQWGGPRVRLMLQTLYIVAYLCLLRFDEALSLTWENVHFEEWEQAFRVRLELTVRKTHQYGGRIIGQSLIYTTTNTNFRFQLLLQVLHHSTSIPTTTVRGSVPFTY